jgi:hypothetical protein
MQVASMPKSGIYNGMIDTASPDGTVALVLLIYEKKSGHG